MNFYSPSSNFNWWYGASGGASNPSHLAAFYHRLPDAKISKIAYRLGGLLVKDRLYKEHGNPEVVDSILDSVRIKIFDYSFDGDVGVLFESLGMKVELVRPFESAYHIIQTRLHPSQVVIISGLFHPQPKEIFQGLFQFVLEGGRLIIVNSAAPVLSMLFPGKFHPMEPSTTVRAPLIIGKERDIFSGYESNEQIDLEFYRPSLELLDKKEGKILAKVRSFREEPLFLKISIGNGVVYVMVSKMFTTEKKIDKLGDYLRGKGGNLATVAAWECAFKSGFQDAI